MNGVSRCDGPRNPLVYGYLDFVRPDETQDLEPVNEFSEKSLASRLESPNFAPPFRSSGARRNRDAWSAVNKFLQKSC
jgi:hypothetical protein